MSSPVHLHCLLDALKWLEWYRNKGYATVPPKAKNRYLLDRRLSATRFAISFDEEDGGWVIAAYAEPPLGWFCGLPWVAAFVSSSKNRQPMISLICGEVEVPEFENIKFKGGKTPAFAIDFHGHPKVLGFLRSSDEITVGQYVYNSGSNIELAKTGKTIPLTIY